MNRIEVSDRELHTILAALRWWQQSGAGESLHDDGIDDIASNGGEVEPLTVDEVDVLCERVNAGG